MNVTKENSPKGILFFMFMVYFRLNNEDVWMDFLKDSPTSYVILIHSSLPSKFVPPSVLRFVLVPTAASEYGRSVGPMNQLLRYALNNSFQTSDRFIFLSENSIPVKPFQMLRHFYFDSKVIRSSEFCITPTNQWLLLNGTEYSVKHHQWITLNKGDATSIINAINANLSFYDVLGKRIPSPLGHSDEEFWHHLFLFSRFDTINQSSHSINLTFPHNLEQGRCTMYVHWPNYHPNSVFRSEIINLKATDVEGQHIIRAPLTLLSQLRKSSSFFFVRKFVDNGTETFLPQRMKKRSFQGFYDASFRGLVSLREGLNILKIYG